MLERDKRFLFDYILLLETGRGNEMLGISDEIVIEKHPDPIKPAHVAKTPTKRGSTVTNVEDTPTKKQRVH